MCYSKCRYEDYFGECQKPRNIPCPENAKDIAAFETEQNLRMELKADEKLYLGFS